VWRRTQDLEGSEVMGARISTGADSKQDYRTPEDLMAAVKVRFGEIVFDLAATADNTQHERYFAPKVILEVVGKGKTKQIISHPHHDSKAYAHDAFEHSWSLLSREFAYSGDKSDLGLLWLNCEFRDIEPWAARCRTESEKGANVLLLTPAAVGSNWFRDQMSSADVYLLNGRPSFIPGQTYNKDCMISHFRPPELLRESKRRGGRPLPEAGGIHIWDWRKDTLRRSWRR